MRRSKAAFLPEPLNTPRAKLYYSARNAIWNSIKILRISPQNNVLLPSYNCGAEIDPFVKAKVKIKFYRIDRFMHIDPDSLHDAIDEHTKAVVVIHYFGFPHDIDRILRICTAHNLYLIEDCAHALYTKYDDKYLGTWGDIGIFSMWKTLPIPDGGALIINNPLLRWDVKTTTPLPSYRYLARVKQLVGRGLITKSRPSGLRNIIRKHGTNPIARLTRLLKVRLNTHRSGQSSDIHFEPNKGDWRISKFSELAMRAINHQEVVGRRRRNFEFMTCRLRQLEQVKIIFDYLPQAVCPSFFPLVVKKPKLLHEHLSRNGIESVIFWSNFHEKFPREHFPDADFLKTHTLALPLHQDLTPKELSFMVDKLTNWKE